MTDFSYRSRLLQFENDEGEGEKPNASSSGSKDHAQVEKTLLNEQIERIAGVGKSLEDDGE